jgi:hypothetical protein
VRACVAIALLAAGCTRILGVHDFPPEVVETSKTCFGTMFPVCFDAALPDPLTLTGAIDTTDALCRGLLADGTPACIIAATDLTIMDIHVRGTLPLVLVAQDQLTIVGTLDAASRAAKVGPNGSSTDCVPATPGWGEDQNNLRSSAGGAGGSYGSAGGDGGGALGQSNNATDIGGGRANPVATAIGLHGGCAGSSGGVPISGPMIGAAIAPAAGGAGGGAVLLVADAIQIDGTVDASGGAGIGGASSPQNHQYGGGGGGGGSGGLIAIDAAIVTVTGMLVANGGGGGGGADHIADGATGEDGGLPLDSSAAGGSTTDAGAGAGGGGASRAMAAHVGGMPTISLDGGAGGGGGGTGVILSVTAIANASPPVSPP